MHKFIEYISDLLFLHDCVIIPEFGGFICNYRSAYIDEASGRICPPGKDILFNRNLTHNDGLLVNWIATKESISYDKAMAQLNLFCEDLKVKLNQKQRIAFGDIGVFFTDRRFNIIFESGRGNFLSEAYGMEPIEIEKPMAEEPAAKPKQAAAIHPTPQEMAAYINIDSGNFLHRLLKYGLAVAAVAGVIVVTQLDIFDFSAGDSQSIINTTAVQPPMPSFPTINEGVGYNSVIAPSHDYVDYDPINDLAW